MPDAKISALTLLDSTADLSQLSIPLFKADGSPDNARMLASTMFQAVKQLTIAPAWSGTGVATTPLFVNVTADPGPAAPSSRVFDCRVLNSDRFYVNTLGQGFFTGNVTVSSLLAQNVLTRNNSGIIALGTSDDAVLNRDAADILAQRRSSNPQLLRLYELYVGGSDYSRAVFGFRDSAGNTMGTPALRIGTEHAGTGVARAVSIVTGGTERINVGASGGITMPSQAVSGMSSLTIVNDRAQITQTGMALSSAFLLSWGSSTHFGSQDSGIVRAGVNILGITNGSTGPGILAIDKVQGTPFERLKMEWDTTNHVARIGTSKGTGGTARDLAFITDNQVRMTIYGAGGVNVAGGLTAWSLESTSGPIRITTSTPPASSGAAGNAGQITWDSDYLYVAVGSSSWKRIALSTF